MLPVFKNAEQYLLQQQSKMFANWLKVYSNNMFKDVPVRQIHEGRLIRNLNNSAEPQDVPMKTLNVKYSFTTEDVLKDPNIISISIENAAREFAGKQMESFLGTLNDQISKHGNNIQISGNVSAEDLLSMIEKLDIPFDENGEPISYQIHAGKEMYPKLQQAWIELISNETLGKKMDEIINVKRQKWYDRQNTRKLVD